jgi:hypothetical protein
MPMIPNSPDPDRHKKPMWRGWQMPKFRPSLQESLEHRRTGGLGEVHVMDGWRTKPTRKENPVAGAAP